MIYKIKKDIQNYWIAILAVIIYLVFMQIMFSTWCPINALFHVDCPGCGLTHATIYMFTGHFDKAFQANYTVFLWWGLIVLFLVDRYINKFKINILPICFIGVCSITLLRYLFEFLN